MNLVQLLLPMNDNDGRLFPRADFDRVRAELTDRFGSVTAFSESPETDTNGVLLFEVMTPSLDRAWWAAYKKELERRFRPNAVQVRGLPVEPL